MKYLLVALLALTPVAAHADGFRCETASDTLNVTIYNNVDPTIGTRVPAIVILSDSRREFGNKTVATFRGATGLIKSNGASYDLDVDGRFKGVERGGEDIAGTKLIQLKTIKIGIDYSFDRPLEDGARVGGTLVLTKNDGTTISRELDCKRYLKLK
jgi:hypothetical protein